MGNIRINLVQTKDLSYDIEIGSGILNTLGDKILKEFPSKRVFIVTDRNVQNNGHLGSFLGGFPGEEPYSFVIDPPGEISKNMDMTQKIVDTMEEYSYGRDSLLIALGGGTVGDMGGFAATIFKRGVPYIQIPTTTISQADSSVGGKVGVDSRKSKNAYGAFKQPIKVYIDVATLQTLDDRHYRSGLVESIKHGLIRDEEYFNFLEQNIDKICKRDFPTLGYIAEKNCRIKGDVVEQDPEEKNLRQILNYGHTIGHAIELESDFNLYHGEAVAIGILCAGNIAEMLGLIDSSVHERAKKMFEKIGMPTEIPSNITIESILETMKKDKKARGAVPRFVLLDRIGKVHTIDGRYAVPVDEAIVREAIEYKTSHF